MSTSESTQRHKGRVKFFNSVKGFGFILPEATIQDEENINKIEEVFVHHTAIHNEGGFKSLAEGEEVEYDLVQGPKGMQASNVTGPNGVSVQGDSRAHRQPYQSNYQRNNNRGSYNGGGFMMDPYTSAFGYGGIQGLPYMPQQQPQNQQHYGQQYQQPYGGGGYHPSQQQNPMSPAYNYNALFTPNNPSYYGGGSGSGSNIMTSTPISPSLLSQQQQQQQQTRPNDNNTPNTNET